MVDDVFKIVGGYTGNYSGLEIISLNKHGLMMMMVFFLFSFEFTL
jgi:hypothetical protein